MVNGTWNKKKLTDSLTVKKLRKVLSFHMEEHEVEAELGSIIKNLTLNEKGKFDYMEFVLNYLQVQFGIAKETLRNKFEQVCEGSDLPMSA
jgi:hypothetical protein